MLSNSIPPKRATYEYSEDGSHHLPELKRYGDGPELATRSVAAGVGIGTLMPPGVVLIVYGLLTEQSIGKLFVAGVTPVFLVAILFCIAIYS